MNCVFGPFCFYSVRARKLVEAFRVCKPTKELTGPELRRWHGRVVVGILLAGSAARVLGYGLGTHAVNGVGRG